MVKAFLSEPNSVFAMDRVLQFFCQKSDMTSYDRSIKYIDKPKEICYTVDHGAKRMWRNWQTRRS